MKDKDKCKRLEEQLLSVQKELSELRKWHNNLAKKVMGIETTTMSKQDFSKVSNGFTTIIDAVCNLCVTKKVFEDEELRVQMNKEFDRRNGIVPVNHEEIEELEDGMFSMIKFKCMKDEVVIFEEKMFTLYQIGSGFLPFENKIKKCVPGAVDTFNVKFSENFKNKQLAGKETAVILESEAWKKNTRKVERKVDGDSPRKMNEEGELV